MTQYSFCKQLLTEACSGTDTALPLRSEKPGRCLMKQRTSVYTSLISPGGSKSWWVVKKELSRRGHRS